MFKPQFENPDEGVILVHNFLLTINSNRSYVEADVLQAKNNFVDELTTMFGQFENFIDIFVSTKHGGNKYDRVPLRNVTFEDIASNVSVQPRVEVGKKLGKLHCHTLISWSSSDRYFFQINQNRLRQYIKNNMGSYHVDIKWIKGAAEINNVLRYINKDN